MREGRIGLLTSSQTEWPGRLGQPAGSETLSARRQAVRACALVCWCRGVSQAVDAPHVQRRDGHSPGWPREFSSSTEVFEAAASWCVGDGRPGPPQGYVPSPDQAHALPHIQLFGYLQRRSKVRRRPRQGVGEVKGWCRTASQRG